MTRKAMLVLGAFASRLKATRARLRKDARAGSAAIEFAMLALPFFYFLFGIIETGVLFFAQSALTNATEDTARMIRTGQIQGALTSDELVGDICAKLSGLIETSGCKIDLKVDLRVFSGFGGSGYPDVVKPDGALDTDNMAVQATDACKVVLFRAYYPWTIMTPFMGALMSNMPSGNQVLLGAAAAFRTEPFPDATYTTTSQC